MKPTKYTQYLPVFDSIGCERLDEVVKITPGNDPFGGHSFTSSIFISSCIVFSVALVRIDVPRDSDSFESVDET